MATDYDGGEERSVSTTSRVGPAVGLIVAGTFYLLTGLWFIVTGIVAGGIFNSPNFQQNMVEKAKADNPRMTKEEEKQFRAVSENLFYIGFGNGIWGFGQAILGAVAVCGAIAMLNLKSRAAALVGAVSAVIPCSCCWPLGLPFGIWALVTLSQPDLKLAFQQAREHHF